MLIYPSPTDLQVAADNAAQAIHHAAVVQLSGWQAVWSRDPAVVLAELNADANALTIMQLSTQSGTALNGLLDAINDPRFPTRAPLSMPLGYAFDGTQFTYTTPAQPESPEP